MLRTFTLACLVCLLTGSAAAQKSHVSIPQRPLSFLPNRGQAAADVLWEARGAGFTAAFRRDSFTLRISASGGGKKMIEQTIALDGSNAAPRIEALDPLPGKFSFFAGNDSSRWVSGIASYNRLRYKQVYPGVDLLFY